MLALGWLLGRDYQAVAVAEDLLDAVDDRGGGRGRGSGTGGLWEFVEVGVTLDALSF